MFTRRSLTPAALALAPTTTWVAFGGVLQRRP
jgi:hypothetical protein